MIIAINTRFLLDENLEGFGHFIFEHFTRITRTNPEHQFIFIFDRPYNEKFIFSDNVIPVVTGPAARHPVLWKLWYDIKVPRVLKKYKADVFVSADGFCSLTTSVKQLLIIHDLSFLHFPKFIRKSHLLYYKYFTPRFLDTAKSVVTVSEFSKNDIVQQYRIGPERIGVIPNAAREIFKPLAVDIKDEVKKKYTEGREFFIYAGSIHPRKNLKNLLKGFSLFKKRQKSNWKLVLAGRLAWMYDDFLRELETYKYRHDVIMTGYLDEAELAKLLGSAYTLVYPSYFEGFGMPVIEAMQCGVPVITSSNSAMAEVAGAAALYADPSDHNDIGEKMMSIYKDEQLRERLVNDGLQRARNFSWEKSSGELWKEILHLAEN